MKRGLSGALPDEDHTLRLYIPSKVLKLFMNLLGELGGLDELGQIA